MGGRWDERSLGHVIEAQTNDIQTSQGQPNSFLLLDCFVPQMSVCAAVMNEYMTSLNCNAILRPPSALGSTLAT